MSPGGQLSGPGLLGQLDAVLDPARLSALAGRDVRASAVRVKPGASITCALLDASGCSVGWLQVLTPALTAKAGKRLRTATADAPVHLLARDHDRIVLTGPLGADPRIARYLRRLPASIPRSAVLAPQAVLRYNPMRRIVARVGDAAVRVSARPALATARHLDRLAAGGVPLLVPSASSRHVSSAPWFGTRDLAAVLADADPATGGEAARRAGALLAALHGIPPAALAPGHEAPSDDLARGLVGHVETLALLDADLGAHARRVLDRLAPWIGTAAAPAPATESGPGAERVTLHGDASADQVLVDETSGEQRLTDFDRLTVGPAARDLGSLLATAALQGLPEQTGTALLAGYGHHQPLPAPEDLAAWTAVAQLQRVTEPLRQADPMWRDTVAARLTGAEATCPS